MSAYSFSPISNPPHDGAQGVIQLQQQAANAYGPEPLLHQQPQTQSLPTHPTPQPVRCTWEGGRCGIILNNTLPSGIARHLKEYHFNPMSKPWGKKTRGRCLWDPARCSKDAFYENMGKHIAMVHLGSMRRKCPRCGGSFARSDVLARHMFLVDCAKKIRSLRRLF